MENAELIKDDKNKKALFDLISSYESRDGTDLSNFEDMPVLFNGLKTSSFGFSSEFHKNPFFELKKIAMDKNKEWGDRTQAVRYMQRIPHIERDKNCIEATISIVSDYQYHFRDRFHFFSNNEKIIKLSYEIVNALHKYVYENFETLSPHKIPLIYKILSAQHALTQFPIGTYDIDGVQTFLLDIAMDKDVSIEYRSECADILDRTGYYEYKKLGRKIINELGDLYNENKRQTIYSNMQNVHNETITKKIIETLRYLMSDVKDNNRHTGEIYEMIVEHTKDDKERGEQINKSLQRILIDTSRYEGLTMVDILLLVWNKICSSKDKYQMENRLLEELYDMYKTCSSGHLSRIINILSGFYDEIQPVKISFSDQLKSNVFARYTSYMKTLGQHEQDNIITEMLEDKKPTIEEFMFSYSPKDELRDEFVPEYMTEELFDEVFSVAEKTFFGYN